MEYKLQPCLPWSNLLYEAHNLQHSSRTTLYVW